MNLRDPRVLHQLYETKIREIRTRNGVSPKNTKSEDPELLWKLAFEALCVDIRKVINSKKEDPFELMSVGPKENSIDIAIMEDPLGELYEYYLQNQLIITDSQIRVEPKPIKERTQGIFYTPDEIIQSIINEVAQFMDKDPSEVTKVADLSCGTGRFLRKWHLNYLYLDYKGKCPQFEYYGYDIDPIAIQLASSLNQSYHFHWAVKDILSEDLQEKFNVIIGNPPYIESRDIPDAEWDQFRVKYQTAYKRFDLAVIFLERIFQCLRPGGLCGLIITNKWLVSDYGEKIRELLLTQTQIMKIIDISKFSIFRDVSTYPVLIFFRKRIDEMPIDPAHRIRVLSPRSREMDFEKFDESPLLQSNFLQLPKRIIPLGLDEATLLRLILFFNQPKGIVFGLESAESPYELRDGIHTGNIRTKIIQKSKIALPAPFKRALTSRFKVSRYKLKWDWLWIRYDPSIIQKMKGEYASFREEWIFTATPKLIIKLFGKTLQVALDREGFYVNNSLILVVKRPNPGKYDPTSWFSSPEEEFYFLLGLLNSGPISQYYNFLFGQTHVRGNYIQYYTKDLAQIPIPIATEKSFPYMQDIATLAQKLEILHDPQSKSTPAEIEGIEHELDQKVDRLYQIITL